MAGVDYVGCPSYSWVMSITAVERATAWNRNNRVRRAEITARYRARVEPERQKLIAEAYAALGNVCAECGYKDNPLGFELDHVFDDGAVDRNVHGKIYELRNLRKWKSMGWQWHTPIQLLCASCNRVKSSVLARKGKNIDPESRHYKIRTAAIKAYNSGSLSCSCGETRLDALEIAHVNGDGAEHRAELKARGYSGAGMAGLLYSAFYHTGHWPQDRKLTVMCRTCHRVYDLSKAS